MTRLKTTKLSPTDERRHPLSGGRGKIAVAALVLSVGVAAAVVFRKTPAETPLSPALSDPPLVLREEPPRATPKAAPAPHLVGRIDPLDLRDQTPGADPMRAASKSDYSGSDKRDMKKRDLAPAIGRAPPPLLPSSFPARSGAAEAPPVTRPTAGPRVHRVRDGDTLSELARTYLGDGELYLQIYEANRKINGGVLESPDLLPIGAELKIPAADRAPPPTASEDAWQPQPLVPIPPGALNRGDTSANPPRTYRVRRNDTLSGVAQMFYRDATRYQDLFEANRDRVARPDRLIEGTELVVP